MNKRVKRMWINRLISGEYKQGQAALCIANHNPDQPDKFCCLGVLCDLAVEKGVIDPPHILNTGVYYDGERGVLPESVQRWAGLNDLDPVVALDVKDTAKYEKTSVSLAGLNDSGKTFKTIAKLIEKYL